MLLGSSAEAEKKTSSKVEVATLCRNIHETFSSPLPEEAGTVVLLLGELYYVLQNTQNERDKEALNNASSFLKEKLTKADVEKLWDAIHHFFMRREEMPQSFTTIVNKLKREMIHDFSFLKFIEVEALLALEEGGSTQWYREILIAIIRKHLTEEGHDVLPDPSLHNLLVQREPENGCTSMHKFIQGCKSLPLKNLELLGSKNSKIAELLLSDISGSEEYFELSVKFAEIYPDLRSVIAKSWQAKFTHYPQQQEKVLPLLAKLKEQYSEFKDISLGEFKERIHPMGNSSHNNSPINLMNATLGSAFTLTATVGLHVARSYTCLFSLAATCSASTLSLGAVVAASAPVTVPVTVMAGVMGTALIARKLAKKT